MSKNRFGRDADDPLDHPLINCVRGNEQSAEYEQDRRYGLERFSKETRRLYGVLDRRLADHEFVAGAYSIADIAILGWAWRHERHEVSFDDFKNVGRWYDALMARPAVKRGFEVKLS